MKLLYASFLLALATNMLAADAGKEIGELLMKHRRSVAVVKDADGGGSAFIAQIGKGKYLITNQHVVAGHANPSFTMPDRTQLKVGSAAAALGHDIMSFGISDDVTAIEVMQNVEQYAAIGDDVVVLGNPDAAGVIHPIAGKVVGIGPQLVEVSAAFVAGNSGSPIVHVKTGKVIGVATYITREAKNIDEGRLTPTIRRFGFRLDSIKRWEPVRWWHYNDDYETVEKIHQRSLELLAILTRLREGKTTHPNAVRDPMVQAPLAKFAQNLRTSRSQKEYLDGAEEFMKGLQRASSEDIDIARRRVGYDFFLERLAEEERLRAPIAAILDTVLKTKPEL
jgi:hypothetical protein